MATKKEPSPFDNLKSTNANMRQSVSWYQSEIKKLHRASYQPSTLLSSTKHLVANPTPGKMYLFKYDAKWKDTLPYWDAFPCIFFLEKKDSLHYYGINVHYLPPLLRFKLLENLYDLANNSKFDATTRIKMNWDIISRLSRAKNLGVESAIKMYLYPQMQSRFLEVNASSWPLVALLPIEQFQKATKQKVWYDTTHRR
jgi:hypothetical protein